jgi:hypothetical protein
MITVKQANNCYMRVVLELKIHLVEKSVQDIMDVSRSELQANKRIFGGVADEEDDDDDRTGAGPAAEYGKPIFAPTVRLAAPVFRKITLFSDAVKRLFYDEGIYLPQFASASASAASMDVGIGSGIQRQSSAVPRAVSQLQGGNHPNKQSNLMKGSGSGGGQASGASGAMLTYTSKLLELVQATLENELLPVVQSAVNSEMQNIQNRPDLFAIQNTMDVLNLMTGATDLFVNLCCVLFDIGYLCNATENIAGSLPLLSPAALSTAKVASPLFHYWLQLPEHRNMVVTILDRCACSIYMCDRYLCTAVSE